MRESIVFVLAIVTACVAECIPLLIAGVAITALVALMGRNRC